MITKYNLRNLLTCIGFQQSETVQDEMNLHFDNTNCTIAVDFSNEKIIYPEGIEADRDTTKNFSANENFVVLECVVGLLAQGYKPENIVLEPKTPGGREDSHFYCDILIRDNDKRPYMLIECKTMDGKDDDEFSKAWKKTLQDGGQLFNYYNTYRQAQYLVLYASDFVDGEPHCNYRLITMTDNKEYLESNPQLLSFEKVSADNGTRDDFFKVWSETYGKDYATNGAFEVDEVPAFGVSKKKMTIDDLIIVDGQDIQRKYHQFAQTLRQYNVASHENAFDKLVNLFLVKVVDEVRNPKDLQFLWKGAAYDDYYSFQDRLQKLYQIGMKDYLGEDVTYIDNASIENAFRMQKNDPDAIKDTILEYFRQLKFYSNSDFGFLDVHNKQLFVQNAVILKAMVEMLQDMRLKTEQQNQFLGDLFEGFLDQGVKQNEGQFFTPTPITRFMVSSLPLEQIIRDNTDIPKAIDYACGAGHFLNEYASQIKPFVEQYKGEQSLVDYYKQIYGIEKEYRLSKVSKVSSFMYGQDGIQIVYGDALVPHEAIKDGDFKVLVANPPYSVTGFLATLSKEQRDAYVLSADVDSKQLETNNSIETFFIERAKQLLAPEGVAAIILPSSILSNSSNIYVKTREILLQYFDFVAIAEFGSGTFGKTGTNTVVLFLRRKKSEPELAIHYRNRVEAWFSNNHGQDHRYEDADAIERYTQHIGVPYDEYLTLLNGNPSEDLMKHEIFAAYKAEFSNNTAAKNIKKKRVTARYTQSLKDAELAKHILDSIRNMEKDKLYYFMLCESNPQSVIVVKSPTKTAETKKFLGYEWSNRKGSEGIKYLGAVVEDDDNEIAANKGILQIQTPLFDPQNLFNEEKINTLIRKNYLGEDVDVPEQISEHLTILNLVDMIDFKRVELNVSIKTSVEFKMNFETKFEKVRLDSIILINPSKKDLKIEDTSTNVSFVDMPAVSEKGYIEKKIDKPYSEVRTGGYTYFADNDIILAKITPCMENGKCAIATGLTNGIGFGSSEFHVLRCTKKIHNLYLFALLNTQEVRRVAEKNMTGSSGHRRVPASFYANMEIPLPPLDIQKKIADECKKVDEEVIEKQGESNALMHTVISTMNSLTYPTVKLAELCKQINNGLNIKQSIMAKGLPITRIETIATGTLNRDKMGYGNLMSSIGKESYLLENGDILMSHINSHKFVGKCALVNDIADGEEIIHGMNLLRIKVNERVLPEYLYLYFLSERFKTSIDPYIIDAVNQSSINVTNLSSIEIPIPSLEDQRELVSNLMDKLIQVNQCKEYIQSANSLKQTILDKYLK